VSDQQADFVVVANRLPVDLELGEDGSKRWKSSPGGLVTALEPLLRSRHGAWVGWPGLADAEAEPFSDDGLELHPVTLTAEDVEYYYEGFSNDTLWPLYHDVVASPSYHRHWWRAYVRVNQRFAAAAAEVAAEGATVWVQDYQLQLVPFLLREQRPDLRIGFFLHIPFPPRELFVQLPWREQVVRGLLGADLVGFHTPGGAANFRDLAVRLAGAEPGPGEDELTFEDRVIRLGAFPISIDSGSLDAMSRRPEVVERAKEIRRELGEPRKMLLGVDRLDYTKGIDVRLKAFEELLDEGRVGDDVVFLQIATPSRERVEHYVRLREEIERTVGRLNGAHGSIGHQPVQYLHQSMPRDELTAFYLAADVMLVTPLRDGMNLVAKEYVACRHDDGGVLVLSEFTGAAEELTSALLVNPHDTDGVKAAIARALEMPEDDARQRMHALREQVLEHDVARWAREFLDALGLPS
jgi:trehalose 6-phosphate synthase